MVAIAALAVFGVTLAFGGAHSQRFGRNKIQYEDLQWRVLSTPHFDIHFYQGSEAFAARAGLVLEDGYDMLSYKLKTVLPWRVPVILYSSHNDFLQTNVTTSLLPEGVQAFAEPSRRRIVLPFTSSFPEFAHTAIHELAHVFTFEIVYNRMLDNIFTRSYVFPMSLWIAEGLAEYLAVKWDTDADMFIRDAVIHDYLFPLEGLTGYYVYKQGQSVMNYIEETYGPDKVLDILHALAGTRSGDAALERTVGLNTEELSERWKTALRKHYWPLYPDKVDIDEYGRRLTDHLEDYAYYNMKPVMSPDGEKIVFFSDRGGLIDIYLMSALDGKIIRKLVSGHRSNRFESLHFMNSSITFSADGKYIAFVAKSKGHDTLFIVETESGKVNKEISIAADGLAAPDWSPAKNEIILSATFDGETDLVLVDVEKGTFRRLTDDPADQLTPRFFPDGKRVAFTYYPEITINVPTDFSGDNRQQLSEMDFVSGKNVVLGKSYDIWEYDIETGRSRPLVESSGDDTSPVVLSDGVTLVYTSDESGINNLHTGSIETGEYHRVTDVLGGIFTPDVNEATGRITFSAFRKAGYDVFISDDLEGILNRRYDQTEPPPLLHALGSSPYDSPRAEEVTSRSARMRAAVAAIADSASASAPASDSTGVAASPGGPAPGADSLAVSAADPSNVQSFRPPIRVVPRVVPRQEVTAGRGSVPAAGAGGAAQGAAGTQRDPGAQGGGLVAGPRGAEGEFSGGVVKPYRTRLAPDYIGQGAGISFSTGFGFGLSNSVALSDMLGNHRLGIAFNLYSDITESDFLASYIYLKNRIDYAAGVYQFKNYFNSRMTSMGETFGSYRLFSERNVGLFGIASVPFNTYYRMDLELQAYMSYREFFDRPASGIPIYTTTEKSTRHLIEPAIAFVHDSSFWGYFGPVEGSRWRVSAAQGLSFSYDDVSRTTVFLDYRWYKMLFYRNTLAVRFAGGFSEGRDPRVFFLGGPLTLRGYDYLQFEGDRMVLGSIEYRFPLLDAIIFGWPGRWGFQNVGGTVFFDAGSAWYQNNVHFIRHDTNRLVLNDMKSNFGVGAYLNLAYFLLSFQFAWPTDLQRTTSDYQFHFYIGPTF